MSEANQQNQTPENQVSKPKRNPFIAFTKNPIAIAILVVVVIVGLFLVSVTGRMYPVKFISKKLKSRHQLSPWDQIHLACLKKCMSKRAIGLILANLCLMSADEPPMP